ncbi:MULTISPECIES: HTH-type transcriptional repressor FabR [unclassified Hahella]|uniref:HTH-type transcriptional repressor FabR n=1 Tax=unclassified Hahella TaxID=2624107 RepID=UPI001C1F17EF|nr:MULTISPECIES: HTH-type transcriptional repressor FabR [unclassified Hahella]MBU6954402.1 HTH-type transcriptional repressor FabR [Hahella sp. HN01]MDG9671915.1 HTH-type transcriptional repressor FabR [Hahella sp. CR1]
MAVRAEKKQQVNRNICNAALRLCRTKGYSGVSLREICREAGIAPPTFYNYYPNLEELGLAIIDEAGLTLRRLMRQTWKEVDVREGVVRRTIRVFGRYLEENGDLFHFVAAERVGRVQAFRDAIEREVKHVVEAMAKPLAEVGAATDRPVAHPLYLSEMLVNCAFQAGVESLSANTEKRNEIIERTIIQARMAIYGSEAMAKGAVASVSAE